MGKNSLPEHWEIKKLGDVCKLRNGYAFKSSDYSKTGIPIIRISDIQGGLVNPQNSVCIPKNILFDDYIIKEGDILVAMSGATTGKFGVYKSKFNSYQNQRVGKFDILNRKILESNFLLYQLFSLKKQIEKDAYGGAQPNISSKKIEEMEIYLPPLQEQQAIVQKIEELFSELDNSIQNLKTAQKQIKIYRQSVLKSAFEGKLNEEKNANLQKVAEPHTEYGDKKLPDGWKKSELRDVCSNIKVGIVIKPSEFYSPDKNGVKVFRSANVKEFSIQDKDWVYFTNEGNDKNSRTKLKTNDVLIVRSGYPGTSCVVTEKYSGCNAIDVLIATPNPEKIDAKFLCAFNNSPFAKGLFKAGERGVAQKHLNVGVYSKLSINHPDISEQRRIISEIESRFSVADKLEEAINQSLEQAEVLRQSILKKAFEGKLIYNYSHEYSSSKNQGFSSGRTY